MWSILLCNTDRKLTGLNGIEMTGIIEIEGMEFFAYHGCFEAEQIVGNRFMLVYIIIAIVRLPQMISLML